MSESDVHGAIRPDGKDWTWVLDRPCPECGYDAAAVPDLATVAAAIRDNAEVWRRTLAGPRVERRPRPDVWSPTEYAAHVCDVHRVFAARLELMLGQDGVAFANWDQDATAAEDHYDRQRAADVAPDLVAAAGVVADAYAAVPDSALGRRGIRSNVSTFTVASLARYHLHDVVHHLWDVRAAVTLAGYEAAAADYRDDSPSAPTHLVADIAAFAAGLGAGARVLEIGSGGGRDALAMEAVGLDVRRTDVTPAFVELQRAAGHAADVLDPLTDDLADPEDPARPYDGVWANASLLHVSRADLPTVLERLAAATRPGGRLRMSVKEGDGEGWSTHGRVATPRMFVYWRAEPVRAALAGAGWTVEVIVDRDGQRGERWLEVDARRTTVPGGTSDPPGTMEA